MNFSELRFWSSLLGVLLPILLIRPFFIRLTDKNPKAVSLYDRSSLLLIGLFLLGCANLWTLIIFLSVKFITYFGLALILQQKNRNKNLFLFFLVPIQLAPLIYYKYADFLANGMLGLTISSFSNMIIPIGLSFYSFQAISFVIDTVIHKEPLPGFLNFMNFASFFPQIVAGPIERRQDLLPQMESFRFRWNAAAIDQGVPWIVIGLFFKICLSDNLALYFEPSSTTNPFSIWLNNIIFGFRIYYDFAGYSFVALGIARCFGISLTLNFASPYLSRNAQEFWRRWHISLSTWFRDYVYLPLGGSRTKVWFLSIILVFVVSGIWHGAGWNFILWGFLWAIFLVIFHLSRRARLHPFLGWSMTMLAALLGWLCFYETRINILLLKLAATFNPLNYKLSNLKIALSSIDPTELFVLSVFILLSIATLFVEWLSLRKTGEPYSYLKKPPVLCMLVILTVLLSVAKKNDFIYFAF
jgi:D-alanyl-lipoteichoic acid acyltransferase DltB (MBOAT superfamily)